MGKTAAVAFVPDSESPCLLSRQCKSTIYQEAFFVGGGESTELVSGGSSPPQGFCGGVGGVVLADI